MNSVYVRLDADKSNNCVINEGTDDELAITGYKPTIIRTIVFRLITILTLGLFRLWIYWKPSYGCWRYAKCNLEDANIVTVENIDDDLEFCKISMVDVPERTSDTPIDELPPINVSSRHRSLSGRRQSLFNPEFGRQFSYFDDISSTDNDFHDDSAVRYFLYRGMRFVYDQSKDAFVLLNGLDGRVQCGELVRRYHGWSREEQKCRRQLFGENVIDVKVPSYWSLFYREVLNPFYVFQLCSLILWGAEDYYIYAVCVLLITLVSIAFELYETRTQVESLHEMVQSANETTVQIRRPDGTIELVDSTDLTPGDIIVIPQADSDGFLMPCDVVLLNGSCIVDESILTGESVPIVKVEFMTNDQDDYFETDDHQKHVLFCGTRVIQTRLFGGGEMFGLVVRTGFASSKGALIRSVLYPKMISFEFYHDAMVFLIILAIIAMAGAAYSLALFITRGMELKKVLTNSLDIITIVVPPTLPAAMAVGVWYSQRRLKSKQIYSTSPQRINLCGKLNLICFDKTGTLTEEGLEVNGIVPCEKGEFRPLVENLSTLPFGPLLSCLSTCHSLTVINGQLTGEPVDLRIFELTKWEMDTPMVKEASADSSFAPTVVRPAKTSGSGKLLNRVASMDELISSPPLELGVVRQFPFSSDLRRCTVVVRQLGAFPMMVYVKGAPEQIASICKPETIPRDFKNRIDEEAMLGRRVLALAYRELPKKVLWHHVQRMKREDLERDMEFLGIVIFHNRLKPPTTAVIDELRRARIRCVMVTGDSLLTSLCVARESHMIDDCNDIYIVNASEDEDEDEPNLYLTFRPYPDSEKLPQLSYQNGHTTVDGIMDATRFAISGADFALIRDYSADILKQIVSRGVVFARMRPQQKAQLIEVLQDLGYIVGMCGDGANDCSALKAAHAGISLSDLEASVAAPFTCRVQTIECIPELIKEGRCALVTSFGVFKYMTMYSMIQFVSVLILYNLNMFFADYMYLFIDLFIITVIAIFMGRTGASDKLDRTQPSAKLFSYPTIFSLLAHLVVLIGVQVGAFFYLRSRIWYGPVYPDPNVELSFSWETTTIFFVSCYQYLIMALVFASGPPYRKPFYTNYPFVFSLAFFAVALTFLLFARINTLDHWLELIPIPHTLWRFQLTLVLLALLNLALCLLIEFAFSCLDSKSSHGHYRRDRSHIFHPRSTYRGKYAT